MSDLLNGLIVQTPTSVTVTGGSASGTINSDGSVSISNCSTVTLNGVFQSTYDNYMVVIRLIGSGGFDFGFRFSSGGSVNTSSYGYVFLRADGSTIGGSGYDYSDIQLGVFGSNPVGMTQYVYCPAKSLATTTRTVDVHGNSGAKIEQFVGQHNVSSPFDGAHYYSRQAQTISGTFTVFAYNQ